MNIPRRNCIKTKEELEEAIKDTIARYKEIVFGSNTHACMACLNELRKQQIIVQKYLIQSWWKKQWGNSHRRENILMDGDTMIDKGSGEVMDPDVDFTY